jgi:hypothetical protein
LWYWVLNSASTLRPPTSPSSGWVFQDRVSWIICLGWLWIVTPLISDTWVARITGRPLAASSLMHLYLAWMVSVVFLAIYFLFYSILSVMIQEIISIFLYLLKFALWPMVWSILEKRSMGCWEKCVICFTGWNIL